MNSKSLKRNNRARNGILIAPSKLPRFSRVVSFSLRQKVGFGPNVAARMAAGSVNGEEFSNRSKDTIVSARWDHRVPLKKNTSVLEESSLHMFALGQPYARQPWQIRAVLLRASFADTLAMQ